MTDPLCKLHTPRAHTHAKLGTSRSGGIPPSLQHTYMAPATELGSDGSPWPLPHHAPPPPIESYRDPPSQGPIRRISAGLYPLYYYIPTSLLIRRILGHRSASASSRRMAVAEVCQFVVCVEAVARHQVGGIAEGTIRKRALRIRRFYAGLRRFNPGRPNGR